MTGEYDYLLHLRVAALAALRAPVRDRLIGIESVGATHSSIALQQIKYSTTLALSAAASLARRGER